MPGPHDQSDVPVARRRRRFTDRQLLVSEGFFSGTATAAHQTFFVPLLVQLGIGSLALGVYSSLNGLLTNASGLAGVRLRRRMPNRRTLSAVTGGLGRLGFLVIALLLIVGGADTSPLLLIAIALLSATLVGLGLPVLTSVVADAISQRERGAFFARRLVASGAGAALVAIGIAALLRAMTFPNGFIIAYALAAAAGAGSVATIVSLRRVRDEPAGDTPTQSTGSTSRISALMWRYAAATFTLWFGASLVAPVLTPFIIDDLGASPSFLGLMGAVNAVVGILVQRFWGRRVDRNGSYPVLSVCMAAVTTLPILYAITPTYWLALGFEVVSGAAWSGYALGNVNYALEIAPGGQRSHYMSVASAAAGIGSFLGPLVAALLLGVLDPRLVLFVSGATRFAAFLALRLAKPVPAAVVSPASPS